MKLLLLGATGPTGLHLVEFALAAGHSVTAIVRSPEKLAQITNENLTTVKSSIFDAGQLSNCFEGHDAIISCLGARGTRPWAKTTLYSDSISAITQAMRTTGIKRLIVLTSSLLVLDGRENIFLKYALRGFLAKAIMDDMLRMETYMFENCSDLDYTIFRPTYLSNDPLSEKQPVLIPDAYQCFEPNVVYKISRANVAKEMLRAAEENKFVRQPMFITMPKES